MIHYRWVGFKIPKGWQGRFCLEIVKQFKKRRGANNVKSRLHNNDLVGFYTTCTAVNIKAQSSRAVPSDDAKESEERKKKKGRKIHQVRYGSKEHTRVIWSAFACLGEGL